MAKTEQDSIRRLKQARGKALIFILHTLLSRVSAPILVFLIIGESSVYLLMTIMGDKDILMI